MPNIKSAKKRLRQNEKRKQRNVAAKTRMRTETKKALAGGEAGAAFSVIDRAAAKGIIHPNAAARRKSRIARSTAAQQAK